MADFDELFKHITGKFPYPLAALALKTSEVEVGDPLNTEHITVRMHRSDMTFHIKLADEAAILHIEAQTDDSRHRPMPLRMLAYSSVLALFQNPITEALMQESPFYEHVLQQGVAQGKREAVLRLLRRQFQDVPEPIAQRIAAIDSISALDTLFDRAMTAKSLDDLQI